MEAREDGNWLVRLIQYFQSYRSLKIAFLYHLVGINQRRLTTRQSSRGHLGSADKTVIREKRTLCGTAVNHSTSVTEPDWKNVLTPFPGAGLGTPQGGVLFLELK